MLHDPDDSAGNAVGIPPSDDQYHALFAATPTPLLIVAPPDWTIVAANDAHLAITGGRRDQVVGRLLFDVYPDNTDNPEADGVRNLNASFNRVVASRATDVMPLQRYAFEGPGGVFVEKWWAVVNAPLLDRSGAVALIVHHVEDVTEVVRLRGVRAGLDEIASAQQIVIDRLRASQAALAQSEGRFQAAFAAIQGVLWTNNAAGEMEGDQPGWAALTGQDPEEYRGHGWADAVHPDDAKPTIDAWNLAVAEKRPFVFEHRVRRDDGEYRRFAARAIPVFDAEGEIDQWVGVHTDIEDEVKAQAALRESETRFRSMADGAPVMMWVTDPTGYCTHLNARWYEYTGQEPGAGEAYGWLDAVHPEDRPAAKQAFVAANAEQRDYRVDFRLRRADGVYRWTIDAAAARFDDDGKFLGYIGSVIDIDERREAEFALRESDARLRELNADLERKVTERALGRSRTWQLSPEIMGVLNADGIFEQSNPAWMTTLGWSEQELSRTRFMEFIHPDDFGRSQEAWVAATERGEPALKFENRYRMKDGGWRWLSWVAIPDDDKIYCSARDVTAEKEQAEALLHAEEALRQSQKMEAMGQLTGGVAHDFNNLLTPIVGSLDLLQRKGLGGEREQRLIAGAIQSADRAKTLVQRLLAFARRQPLQAVAVDISALVAGIAELVEATSGPQIKVVVDAGDQLPSAMADPNQLEMALLNLGVNARDAMPDGGTLRITASADRVEAGHRSRLNAGDYIRLSVADNGCGMDEATRKRAIEPFYSTKGIGKGTGLGLSMVEGLASQLGGALTIESRPGVGTNVELWLPISTAAPSAVATPAAGPAAAGASRTVLLVDDEDLVRLSTADMLADLGYRVIEATSADEALHMLDKGLTPDLLVTDHLMAGMNGTELAHAVRAQRPGLRVLIVSGYAENEGIDADLPRLTKPFRSNELAGMLAGLTTAA